MKLTSVCAIVCLQLALLTTGALAEPVAAAGALEISTAYPATVAKAGDDLTFDLDIDNRSGASVDVALSIESLPEGWSGSFSAGSRQVSVVHVKDEEINADVDLTVSIPVEAEDGEYAIRVRGDAQGFSEVLELLLTVSAEETGQSGFTVEYPAQEGGADTAFSFAATLINNTLSEQAYSFASAAPSGWQVSVLPAGESTKVAGISVEARSTQALEISVTPSANVEAGVYDIGVTATSAAERLPIELSVTITGSYALDLSTPSGRISLDAYANQESAVQLTLTNSGNTDLANVNLTSSAAEGWSVRFASETIEIIEAGATVETTAYITPGEEAMSGDYVAVVSAGNSDASDRVEFRVTVKTETKWGVAGIAVILVLALGVFAIMRRYGRR